MEILIMLFAITTGVVTFDVGCHSAGGNPSACYKAYDAEKGTSDYSKFN